MPNPVTGAHRVRAEDLRAGLGLESELSFAQDVSIRNPNGDGVAGGAAAEQTERSRYQSESNEASSTDDRWSLAIDVSELWNDMDQLKNLMKSQAGLQTVLVGTALTSAVGLTAGYVLWSIRGGFMLASLAAQMPAWRLIDPLPVLDHTVGLVGPGESLRESEEETLQSIVAGKYQDFS